MQSLSVRKKACLWFQTYMDTKTKNVMFMEMKSILYE